jgi:ribose transport system ATP-binding protein
VTQAVLDVRHVSKTFGGVRALDDVSLQLRAGEIHGLLGQNGSGKSTLIKILSGFHEPEAGATLAVDGVPAALPLPPGEALKRGIAFVHQDLGLVGELTVLDNLRVGRFPRWRQISWRAELRRARDALASFDLTVDAFARVDSLSEIDRALLAIVRAVSDLERTPGRGVLVLDEPTVYLPHDSIERLFAAMRRVAADGRAVLFVSHRLSEVVKITDRVTVLRDGRAVGTVVTGETGAQQIVRMILGAELDESIPEPHGEEGRPVVFQARGVAGPTVRGLDLSLREGETVGLTGLLGAGFADVPYLLYGALGGRGSVRIGGRSTDLHELEPMRSIKDGVVLVPADRARYALIGGLDLADNVGLPLLASRVRRGRLELGRLRRDVEAVLREFDVRPPEAARKVATLSGGNQQKAVLAKWMQLAPKVLLLHEPTQGVDVGARTEIFRAIRAAADAGAAVLIASSEHEDIGQLCDRVLIFDAGRVVRELGGDAVSPQRVLAECYRSHAHA